MTRRSRTSIVEDLVELIAAMPWWGGAIAAVVSYGLFHLLAVQEAAPPEDPRDYVLLGEAFVRGLATALQYVVPAACLVGSAVSAVARRRRAKLDAGVSGPEHAAAVKEMSREQFEMLLAEGFKLKGYIVKDRRGRTADRRVDLELVRGGEFAVVHSRQWRATSVSMDTVRSFHAVMSERGAARGYVVTSGQFSADARAFARGRNIELVDGARLYAMLHDVRMTQTDPQRDSAAKRLAEPACPLCGGRMVKRIAKRGANAGKAFWGCAAYPACSGARPMDVGKLP